MQLTSFTDYGLRALIYMASLPEGRMTSISEVTEVYGVSRNHMVKIINQLSRAGFVTAIRGKMAVSAWVNPLRILVLVMWFASWNPYRWSTVAASFATLPRPVDSNRRFLRQCKVFSRSWTTTHLLIWLKRINRFINYCWWSNEVQSTSRRIAAATERVAVSLQK